VTLNDLAIECNKTLQAGDKADRFNINEMFIIFLDFGH